MELIIEISRNLFTWYVPTSCWLGTFWSENTRLVTGERQYGNEKNPPWIIVRDRKGTRPIRAHPVSNWSTLPSLGGVEFKGPL